MSADLLRRAATTLRDHAEKATPGPWRASLVTSPRSNSTSAVYAGRPGLEVIGSTPKHGGCWRATDAAYIALMHPGVALALADWLEQHERFGFAHDTHPLAVARLILGEPA